jgi:8-oxo-dGTP pyrophosphatase MutT (NUDIX family)
MSKPPNPSATVVLTRDADRAIEVLLLHRSPHKDGQVRPWVFPGGKIDAEDRVTADPVDQALAAAVRETREEAGLELPGRELVPIARWITPEISPRRFDTWFFLGSIGRDAAVRVDGDEICDHRWLRPDDAIAAHHAGEIRLAPPTFVTVSWLEGFERSRDAIATLGRRPMSIFRPRIQPVTGGACMLYPGDAAYPDGELDRPGARNRLWSLETGWRYEQSD